MPSREPSSFASAELPAVKNGTTSAACVEGMRLKHSGWLANKLAAGADRGYSCLGVGKGVRSRDGGLGSQGAVERPAPPAKPSNRSTNDSVPGLSLASGVMAVGWSKRKVGC